MKIIKKETKLIEFEAENTTNQYAKNILSLDINTTIHENQKMTIYSIYFMNEQNENKFEYISEQTYNELLEHLGWGKE